MLNPLFGWDISNGRIDRTLKGAGYTIHIPTRDEANQGIDRWLTEDDDTYVSVQYRINPELQNNSIFLPTLNEQAQTDWVFASVAQLLVYWVVPEKRLLLLEFQALRDTMPHWAARYPTIKARASPHHTVGVWVPTYRFVEIAIQEFKI